MKDIMECPVCCQENIREYYTCEWGVEEDYYHCSKCGYTHHMCFSEYSYGFTNKGSQTDLDNMKQVREENIDKVLKVRSEKGYTEFIDWI